MLLGKSPLLNLMHLSRVHARQLCACQGTETKGNGGRLAVFRAYICDCSNHSNSSANISVVPGAGTMLATSCYYMILYAGKYKPKIKDIKDAFTQAV